MQSSTTWPAPASSSLWFRGVAGHVDAPSRLVCLPYAGGSASLFRDWDDGLPDGFSCAAVQLPGRGPRIREPALSSMDALMDTLLPVLCSVMDRPTVLLGYSNGALMAFECACRLRHTRHAGMLRHLILAASRPPCFPSVGGNTQAMSNAQFLDFLRNLGGMPPSVATSDELLQFLLPMLRADFALGEQYRSTTVRDVVDVPITAIPGTRDTTTAVDEVAQWAAYAGAGFELCSIEGGHFFIHDNPAPLMKIVRRILSGAVASAQAQA